MRTDPTNTGTIDTRFRVALDRMARAGRLKTYVAPVDTNLEVAGLMKKLDGGPAIIFPKPRGFNIPIVGNVLADRENCEAAFGTDQFGIREFVTRALSNPAPPVVVDNAPAQQVVNTDTETLLDELPILHHAPSDSGRFITAGVVIARNPDTGVYNASYHRLQVLSSGRTAINLDYGRHLRFALERASDRGEHLPAVVCIGTDVALQYAAATMGAQMPEDADELAAAGGFSGRPLPVVSAVTQELMVPTETEIVLEGQIRIDETVSEGPFGEFVGFPSPQAEAPVFELTAITHREKPIYHAINGYGRETVMLRKYVLEAGLLKGLQSAVPIVSDVEMTPGGLYRFHAILKICKSSPQHDGLERNAILAAFGAQKDLDLVIAVDDDIDIHDLADVEYALATRMEGSRDIFQIPGARGHEYILVGNKGIRTKIGIDATVPFSDRADFARFQFADVELNDSALIENADILTEIFDQ